MSNRKPADKRYQCCVWYLDPGGFSDMTGFNGKQVRLRRSLAYGTRPERDNCSDAYADMVALLSTSLKGANFTSAFYPTVVEYDEGTQPPHFIERELYFSIDDED